MFLSMLNLNSFVRPGPRGLLDGHTLIPVPLPAVWLEVCRLGRGGGTAMGTARHRHLGRQGGGSRSRTRGRPAPPRPCACRPTISRQPLCLKQFHFQNKMAASVRWWNTLPIQIVSASCLRAPRSLHPIGWPTAAPHGALHLIGWPTHVTGPLCVSARIVFGPGDVCAQKGRIYVFGWP